MARGVALAAVLALLLICAAEARSSSRRLNSGYSKSGSSPSGSSPYTSSPYPKSGSSPSGSSPDVSTPSPDTSSSSPYSKSPSGSSPDVSTPSPDTSSSPYGSSPSGSSPDVSTPSPDTSSSPYGSSPSGSSPDVSTPSPDTETPSPDIETPDTPVTSTPSGGYGGYGAHTGCGTPKFWMGNPGRIPKLLSVVSSLAKLFGPRLLGLIGHKTMLGAIKDESPEAFPSLAREGATSLINAYAYKDFPLSASEVVTQFNSALDSTDLARDQAVKFQRLNQAL